MEKTQPSDVATISLGADWPAEQSRAKPFADSVRICIKCCRKLDSQGKALRKSVNAAIKSTYGDAVELEKTDCFSLCPKGGQVVSTNGKNGSRRLVIIQSDSDVRMAVEYLLRT